MKIIKQYIFLFIISLSLPSYSLAQRDFKNLYKKSTQKSFPDAPISSSSQDEAPYVITIKNPFEYKKSLGWRMYYKGIKVTQHEGSFQFIGAKNPEEFHIVVTHIKTPDSPLIKELEVPYNVPYKYYHLKRKDDLNDIRNFRWIIYETSGNEGFNIPEDALIIVLDPTYIKELSIASWKKESNLIVLPTIVLSKDPLLEEASIKSVLAALDTDPFHRKLEKQSKQEEYTTISRIG
ncbi:hypothetical protein K9K77_03310 [Candidatus Babeliales bacterium]|nr:hypothetical protein [Candidatus Babeliales bacterium]